MLLVLLHDFPDFLSEYYFTICDAIPARCIQLRNVVQCAFPPTLTMPDPHLVDVNTDFGPIPPILSDFSNILGDDLRAGLERIIVERSSSHSTLGLKDRFLLSTPGPSGDHYNLSLINSVVLFIGASSVSQAKAQTGTPLFVSSDPGAQLLLHLASELDPEGVYYLLIKVPRSRAFIQAFLGQHHLMSAVVLNLRYPNAHTQWFSALALFLFSEVETDMFQEIMTTVLLERVMAQRPHPWGAILTFIELLRNAKYDFWSRKYVHMVPEIAAMLESVSSTTLGYSV